MKKFYLKLAVFINVLLLFNLIIACQKEAATVVPAHTAEVSPQVLITNGDAQLVAVPAQTKADETEERGNSVNGAPNYPYYQGDCKIIYKVRGFDPSIPFTGGNNPPCAHSSILFKGYSQPDGQGTLLFSGSQQITGDWQEFVIPFGAYVRFVIQQDLYTGEPIGEKEKPCKFKFITADYGFNRAAYYWYNIQYDQWFPVIMGRYAPKDQSIYGNLYDEYLCEPWCTWTFDFNLYFLVPPEQVYVGAALYCYYDNDVTMSYGPSVITNQPVFSNEEHQTFPVYPIDPNAGSHYRTKAVDISGADGYNMWYNLWGNSGQIGSFFWGLAPYGCTSSGLKCGLTPDPH